MTTAQAQRQRAVKFFNSDLLRKTNRDVVAEIRESLETVNRLIKKELNISKDLRNIQYLSNQFTLRHYYKTFLKLAGA